MAYYHICQRCGCNLDPGERCDCEDAQKKRADFFAALTKVEQKSGQVAFDFEKLREPCRATNY